MGNPTQAQSGHILFRPERGKKKWAKFLWHPSNWITWAKRGKRCSPHAWLSLLKIHARYDEILPTLHMDTKCTKILCFFPPFTCLFAIDMKVTLAFEKKNLVLLLHSIGANCKFLCASVRGIGFPFFLRVSKFGLCVYARRIKSLSPALFPKCGAVG